MSKSVYKREYECDCGVDYGNCGAKNAVILVYFGVSDTYRLFHTDSHMYMGNKEPKTTSGGLDCFNESYLKALTSVINAKDENGQDLTQEERETIFNK